MFRSVQRSVLLGVAIALTAWACSNKSTGSTSTVTTPTTTATVTDTFSGNLTINGAATFQFPVQSSGTITATLVSLGPDSSLAIGVSIGTWNGTACQVVLANDKATQGTTVVGAVSASGTLCARVYDVGQLTATLPFSVSIVHP